MSALVRLLYQSPPVSRSPLDIIRWWESRRLAYNLCVGIMGIVTLMTVGLILALPPGGSMDMVFPAVIVYGVAANLFYTAGWVTQIGFNAWWKDDPPEIGPVLFRQGLIFSIGLTLLPIGLALLGWGVRIVKMLLGILGA